MALRKLEKILMTVGLLSGVIMANAGINKKNDDLRHIGYSIALASGIYTLTKARPYRRR